MSANSEVLRITNDTKNLMKVREFMSRMIRSSALPPNEENKVILAVDEAVSNIVEHGYEAKIEGYIDITVEITDEQFMIRIVDTGKNFDPERIRDPNILEHVRAGKRKGLGIFLMRQIMDEVRYVFKEGVHNELVLIKYVRPPLPGGAPAPAPGPGAPR